MTPRATLFITLALAVRSFASPVGIAASPDGARLFIAMESPPSVITVEVASGQSVAKTTLPSIPGSVAVSPDGKQLYVPAGIAPGELITLDAANGNTLHRQPAGHSPVAATPAPDGQTVFVANQFENRIDAIRPGQGTAATLPAVREPVASAISREGHILFVANLLPHGPANTGDIASEISAIDTRAGEAITIRLPNGSMDARALTLSPDGRFLYVVHTLARYSLPTTQLDRGWMNTSALTIIDATTAKLVTTVLLDDIDLGAANPSGVACSPDGRLLAICHAGTHEISLIDRNALHDRINRVAKGEAVTPVSKSTADIPNDLSFIHPIRRRITLNGNGPRTITATSDGFATACYFSNTLHLVKTGEGLATTVRDIQLAPLGKQSPARTGEQMFYDGTRCFQYWQSCATCHPHTRTDALNWDLLNDGVGNPKQTKSMVFAIKTPPAMVSGIRADAETAIRAGMRHIQFVSYPDSDALALEAYFHSLKPVPSPALADGKLSPAATRGKELFTTARCAACHRGEYLTDMRAHNVGTGTGREAGKKWDTPSLRETWRTAPYLHDGRSATLLDVITTHNPGDIHGKTSDLDKDQLNDLLEYVRSL